MNGAGSGTGPVQDARPGPATLFRPGASMPDVSPASSFAIDVPATLLARARRGEAAAFEHLYRAFERPVFTLALRLTGKREEAQDVLQETMIKLFDKVAEFRGDAPFWGWLRQIAVNEALMQLRRRGRRRAAGAGHGAPAGCDPQRAVAVPRRGLHARGNRPRHGQEPEFFQVA